MLLLSAEHPPPPRSSLCGLLSPSCSGPGLCPIRRLLDRLGGFWGLLGRFYGGYPLQGGGQQMISPADLFVAGIDLALEALHPSAQLLDGLVFRGDQRARLSCSVWVLAGLSSIIRTRPAASFSCSIVPRCTRFLTASTVNPSARAASSTLTPCLDGGPVLSSPTPRRVDHQSPRASPQTLSSHVWGGVCSPDSAYAVCAVGTALALISLSLVFVADLLGEQRHELFLCCMKPRLRFFEQRAAFPV